MPDPDVAAGQQGMHEGRQQSKVRVSRPATGKRENRPGHGQRRQSIECGNQVVRGGQIDRCSEQVGVGLLSKNRNRTDQHKTRPSRWNRTIGLKQMDRGLAKVRTTQRVHEIQGRQIAPLIGPEEVAGPDWSEPVAC